MTGEIRDLCGKSPNWLQKNPSSTPMQCPLQLAVSQASPGNRKTFPLSQGRIRNLQSRAVNFWNGLAGDALWTCISHPLSSWLSRSPPCHAHSGQSLWIQVSESQSLLCWLIISNLQNTKLPQLWGCHGQHRVAVGGTMGCALDRLIGDVCGGERD